jgi:hypothetical protein
VTVVGERDGQGRCHHPRSEYRHGRHARTEDLCR